MSDRRTVFYDWADIAVVVVLVISGTYMVAQVVRWLLSA